MTAKVDSLIDRRKALEEQRMDRIMRARERGLLIFLAKTDEGKDTTNVDIRCAILGLDEKIVRFMVKDMEAFQRIGNVLEALRTEANRVHLCLRLIQQHAMAEERWRALPFWKRWRQPRPRLEGFPAREVPMDDAPTKEVVPVAPRPVPVVKEEAKDGAEVHDERGQA